MEPSLAFLPLVENLNFVHGIQKVSSSPHQMFSSARGMAKEPSPNATALIMVVAHQVFSACPLWDNSCLRFTLPRGGFTLQKTPFCIIVESWIVAVTLCCCELYNCYEIKFSHCYSLPICSRKDATSLVCGVFWVLGFHQLDKCVNTRLPSWLYGPQTSASGLMLSAVVKLSFCERGERKLWPSLPGTDFSAE